MSIACFSRRSLERLKADPKERIGTLTPVLPKDLVGTTFDFDSIESDTTWVAVKDSSGDNNDQAPTAPAVFKNFLRETELLLSVITDLLLTH